MQVRKKETDEVQLRRDGALNQFISELSSNIHGRRYSEAPASGSINVDDKKEQNMSDVNNITNKSTDGADVMNLESTTANEKVSDSANVVEETIEQRKSSDLLAQPSHFVTVIEVKEPATSSVTSTTSTSSSSATTTTTTTTSSVSSSFKSIRSGYENVIIENNKRNSNIINEMDRSSNTSSFNSSRLSTTTAPIALIQDTKKKVPPR